VQTVSAQAVRAAAQVMGRGVLLVPPSEGSQETEAELKAGPCFCFFKDFVFFEFFSKRVFFMFDGFAFKP
jgi:hypothetical protein